MQRFSPRQSLRTLFAMLTPACFLAFIGCRDSILPPEREAGAQVVSVSPAQTDQLFSAA